jgi:outer membrane protein assembly factor BamB
MRHLTAFCILTILATSVRADDWPQWLGRKRDGATAEVVKPWKAPLKILWTQEVGVVEKQIQGHGGPVVAAGAVYLFFGTPGKDEETLAAYDAANGKLRWKASYPRKKVNVPFGNDPRSAPCVVDGKVYTFGITSVLTCFDAGNGKIVWQVDAGKDYNAPALVFGSSCSPIVVADHVILNIGAKGASIVAFDKNTGKEVWKTLDDGATYSSPFLYSDGQKQRLLVLTAKGLVSLAPKNGAVYWQYPFVDLLLESSCTPMMIDDKILISSITAGCALIEIDNYKPKKTWTKSLNCYFSTPVAMGKDTLFMVTGDLFTKKATLRCVDAKTGNEMWNRKGVGQFHATLIRTGDDKLLMVEEKGDLVLIDANRKEYRELSRSKICGPTWAHPAVANGRLYIRDDKDLICVELPKY